MSKQDCTQTKNICRFTNRIDDCGQVLNYFTHNDAHNFSLYDYFTYHFELLQVGVWYNNDDNVNSCTLMMV